MERNRFLLFVFVMIVSIVAGMWGNRYFKHNRALNEASGSVALVQRPDTVLPDLDGRLQTFDQWNGQWLIVNFWASWCAPCREEVPVLIQAQKQYQNLQVIGIAIDTPERVRKFARDYGINYPVLADTIKSIQAAREFGNEEGVIPFTVFCDPQGRIFYRHFGKLDSEQIDQILGSKIQSDGMTRNKAIKSGLLVDSSALRSFSS